MNPSAAIVFAFITATTVLMNSPVLSLQTHSKHRLHSKPQKYTSSQYSERQSKQLDQARTEANSAPATHMLSQEESEFVNALSAIDVKRRDCLLKINESFTAMLPDDDNWRAKLSGNLADLKVIAHQGKQIPCPSRFQDIQTRYNAGLDEYEVAADRMPIAIEQRNVDAINECTNHFQHANDLLQSAKDTLISLEVLSSSSAGVPLEKQVQDYNDFLQQAQNADRNAEEAMRLQSMDFAAAGNGKADGPGSMKQFRADLDQIKFYGDARYDALLAALRLRKTIRSHPHFTSDYHETSLCLVYSHIPASLNGTGASTLRFMEKR